MTMQNDFNEFLDVVLLDHENPDTGHVFCVQTQAADASTPWPPIDEDTLLRRLKRNNGSAAYYVSTMSAKRNSSGKLRNTQTQFYSLNMIVLDDIGDGSGSKVGGNTLVPTYKIESSEDNFQWGYVLANPIKDLALAKQLVGAVYGSDKTDGGGALVNKFVRLPIGINGKQREAGRDMFTVRLAELSGVYYTVEELVEGLGLTLEPIRESVSGEDMGLLPAEDYRRVPDPVLDWLEQEKLLTGAVNGDFLEVTCPWHHHHTGGGDTAGYSPLGLGEYPAHRTFNCFHEHCQERTSQDFLNWVRDRGGPAGARFDPVAPMVARYALLEYSDEVADMWASAEQIYPIVKLNSFKNANRQFISGPRGGKEYFGELWLSHADTIRCKGRVYEPGGDPIRVIDGITHFNTYRAPHHPPIDGEPTLWLEHVAWLLPNLDERELFHDWIAQKIQHPASRSFAYVMVAEVAEGDSGHTYGTGRSTIGDMLKKVFQSGVTKLALEDITGQGDSQSAYNDWADGSQLCIVEETKERAGSYQLDLAAYEKVKTVVDTRPIPGVRVKPKYGKIYETTVYTNFLFLTNHADALQLPGDDRRFYVAKNRTERRSFEEYGAVRALLDSRSGVAQVFNWYMSRDVAGFNSIYPPMTASKQGMIAASKGELDEIWGDALELLPGRIATKNQIEQACLLFCRDLDAQKKVKGMVAARWRKLKTPGIELYSRGWAFRNPKTNQLLRPKIIKSVDEVEGLIVARDFDPLKNEVGENDVKLNIV